MGLTTTPGMTPHYRALSRLLALYAESQGSTSLDARRNSQSALVRGLRLQERGDVAVIERRTSDRQGWCVFEPAGARAAREIFYVHGGGLVFYSVEDYRSLLQHFAALSQCRVSGFSYPPAPENALPEILASLVDSFDRNLKQVPADTEIVLAGDSIGAYWALYLALRCFPRRFHRLVMIYPVLDLHREYASFEAHGRSHFLSAQTMNWFRALSRETAPLRGILRPFDPQRLDDDELAVLPRIVVASAGCDVLRDEAFSWIEFLSARGVPSVHRHFADLPHDFCLHAGRVPPARLAVNEICGLLFE